MDCIKPVFKEFVCLCRSLDLYDAQLVAIDGSKFKAVNSKSNNFNEKNVAFRLKRTEEKIAEYLRLMDENDKTDSGKYESLKVDGLKERICKLEEKKQQFEYAQNQMKATGQKEVSLVDPDSRFMRVVDRLRARLSSFEGKREGTFEAYVGGASIWNDEASFQSGLFAYEGS